MATSSGPTLLRPQASSAHIGEADGSGLSRSERRKLTQRDSELRDTYEELLDYGNSHPNELEDNLNKLRRLILTEGLPTDEENRRTDLSRCALRGKVWKVLLEIEHVDDKEYIELVEKGISTHYQKIRNDTFRTFRNNPDFAARVPEEKLIRILNAFITKCERDGIPLSYVQGMNVICAPFLYVMPEVDAFYCVDKFFRDWCPTYVKAGIEGAYAGVDLVDECLKVVDNELYAYLASKGLTALVYAMPSALSFSAATPPLSEVMKLWDFYMAFGAHMNILAIVAQLVAIRDQLLNTPNPNLLLRDMPPLNSALCINVVCSIVSLIPEGLFLRLQAHATITKTYDLSKMRLDGNRSIRGGRRVRLDVRDFK